MRTDRLPTTKLALVAQYELSGTVTSLARVKIVRSKSGGEALLVALRDAKLSLVEWDPERYSISTISIHYYEREDILSGPWEPDLSQCVNYLTVDPSSRCAAFKFGARHLAILPFHQLGDDVAMDDYDPDLDGDRPIRKQSFSKSEDAEKTPYGPSFVLSLLALDSVLTHPIHLSFLYEYREPTFGILYTQTASSTALLHERRDNVSYAVYTLDLEQRASTTLLSINSLPYDLHTIIPLSRIIGGALLVGANEVIHVDQSGKTNGVAVNEFAKLCTGFGLSDQSDLNMRLEGSIIKQLGHDNAELLIISNEGELAILSFKIDGRSVSGLTIRQVTSQIGKGSIMASASSASLLGRGRMFIGSEDTDSVILGWSRASDRLKRQRSRGDMDVDNDDLADFDDAEIEEDEDDLYVDDKPDAKVPELSATFANGKGEEDYDFRIHDSLMNVGPITDVAFTSPISSSSSELMVTSGRGRVGGLTTFHKEIVPCAEQMYSIPHAQDIWTVSVKIQKTGSGGSTESYDSHIIANTADPGGEVKSRAYSIGKDTLEEVGNTDFDPDAGTTIAIGTLNGGARVVQVLQKEVRAYDGGESSPVPYLSEIPVIADHHVKPSTLPTIDQPRSTEHSFEQCGKAWRDPFMMDLWLCCGYSLPFPAAFQAPYCSMSHSINEILENYHVLSVLPSPLMYFARHCRSPKSVLIRTRLRSCPDIPLCGRRK